MKFCSSSFGAIEVKITNSGLRYVTPADRHRDVDRERHEHRKAVYESAKRRHPQRWLGKIRNWEVPGSVSLNPGKLQEVESNKQVA